MLRSSRASQAGAGFGAWPVGNPAIRRAPTPPTLACDSHAPGRCFPAVSTRPCLWAVVAAFSFLRFPGVHLVSASQFHLPHQPPVPGALVAPRLHWRSDPRGNAAELLRSRPLGAVGLQRAAV